MGHSLKAFCIYGHRYAPLLSQSSKGNIESVDVCPKKGTLTLLYFPESIKGHLVSFVVLRNHFAAALITLHLGAGDHSIAVMGMGNTPIVILLLTDPITLSESRDLNQSYYYSMPNT